MMLRSKNLSPAERTMKHVAARVARYLDHTLKPRCGPRKGIHGLNWNEIAERQVVLPELIRLPHDVADAARIGGTLHRQLGAVHGDV
jgi:hypothetical protein